MMEMRATAMVLALMLATLSAGPVVAQVAAAASDSWTAPRTEHGHPDLQGNWTNATLTPLQRPAGQGPVLSAEQLAQIEGGVEALYEEGVQDSDPDRPPPAVGGDDSALPPSVLTSSFIAAGGGTGGYNIVYIESGDQIAVVNGEPRSSLITFPENGRVPPLTEEARQRRAEENAATRAFGAFDHPELRSLGERCIMSFGSNAGPPMLPNGFYNNNYTVVQTADHVAIMTEMIHDTRIIELRDGAPVPSDVRPYMGVSRGHWEGETLVVETTNLHPVQGVNGTSSPNTRVVERFTRVNPETILYEFTVEDPTVWTEPWGGQVPMRKLDEQLHEYACHEGNYSFRNILSGARFEERQAAEQTEQR
ncbi:MAG: hypothetical protein WD766_06085 [Gemmatimonadota bacterium]